MLMHIQWRKESSIIEKIGKIMKKDELCFLE